MDLNLLHDYLHFVASTNLYSSGAEFILPALVMLGSFGYQRYVVTRDGGHGLISDNTDRNAIMLLINTIGNVALFFAWTILPGLIALAAITTGAGYATNKVAVYSGKEARAKRKAARIARRDAKRAEIVSEYLWVEANGTNLAGIEMDTTEFLVSVPLEDYEIAELTDEISSTVSDGYGNIATIEGSSALVTKPFHLIRKELGLSNNVLGS